MLRPLIAAWAIFAVLAGFARPALPQLSGEMARNNLRMECATMSLEFFGGKSFPVRRAKKILDAAESRLRASRVFRDSPPIIQRLEISVWEPEPAVTVSVRLYRFLLDTGGGHYGSVIVWQRSNFAVYANDQQVCGIVSALVDGFLAEYLRANPECGR